MNTAYPTPFTSMTAVVWSVPATVPVRYAIIRYSYLSPYRSASREVGPLFSR